MYYWDIATICSPLENNNTILRYLNAKGSKDN